ncbi:MAG: Mth938-like domain-containing protein [Bacillota bacterium]
MKIEDYSFGEVVIDGQHYSSDLLICGERIKSDWWRVEGHSLCREDLIWVLEQQPDLLIIGTGKSGRMSVPRRLKKDLRQELDLLVYKTEKAVKEFNQRQEQGIKVAAGFHLTC